MMSDPARRHSQMPGVRITTSYDTPGRKAEMIAAADTFIAHCGTDGVDPDGPMVWEVEYAISLDKPFLVGFEEGAKIPPGLFDEANVVGVIEEKDARTLATAIGAFLTAVSLGAEKEEYLRLMEYDRDIDDKIRRYTVG